MSESTSTATPVSTPAPAPTAAPITTPTPPPVDNVQTRINELTAARKAAEERVAQLEAIVSRTATPQVQQSPAAAPELSAPPAGVDQSVIEQMVSNRLAEQLFNAKADAIYTSGKEKFGAEFDNAVTSIRGVYNGTVPTALVQAAMETPDPAATLHYIGTHTEEARRIGQLAPVSAAAAVAVLGSKITKPATSGAPPPLPTVPSGTSTTSGAPTPEMTTADWMQARANQIASERKRAIDLRNALRG